MDLFKKIDRYTVEGKIPQKYAELSKQFYSSYKNAVSSNGEMPPEAQQAFERFIELMKEQIAHPYKFETYHKKITTPFNYYEFGLNFIRPFLDMPSSIILRSHLVDKMEQQIKNGENVIFLANHQTEMDPQVLYILLEDTHLEFSSEIIFVAGERVTTDPMAIPLSLGVNLLCIYSKKHIDNTPELKLEKQEHNRRTMLLMKQLLAEGGKTIYVAPSGGRDRPNEEGEFVVAPFDPASIQMFRLMADQAGKPTHFYPLALLTYHLLPPPNAVEKEIGEKRQTHRGAAYIAFGEEIDMDHFEGSDIKDKHQRREALAQHVWNLVQQGYLDLLKHKHE